jgi:hypothetical protein
MTIGTIGTIGMTKTSKRLAGLFEPPVLAMRVG